MSKISDRDSKLEVFVRKALFAEGFRFRKNDTSLPGKPDIVLPKYNTIIFTHGCFWHGHQGCKASKLPESRRDFWEKKIKDNIERDNRNNNLLQQSGWEIITLWQCEFNTERNRQVRLNILIDEVRGN
jgi:DNA mismatch endonuclease (patch repair protein)